MKTIELNPVILGFIADTDTPVSIFLKLRKYFKLPFLFESVESGNRIGRFSFIGLNPIFEYIAEKDSAKIKPIENWFNYQLENNEPISALKEIYDLFKTQKLEHIPSFSSGLVGYFSYESIGLSEKKLKF